MAERTERTQGFVVRLTLPEVRALRMALIFGAPDVPHPVLESARVKLNEVEATAGRED